MNRFILTLALAALAASPAAAQNLYSIDNNTQRVVRINAVTAAITVVGPLPGFNGTILDMEFLGARLFAVANVTPNKELFELNPATGAILSNVIIRRDGAPIINAAEGLASDDKGNLLLSFWNGSDPQSVSSLIGLLALDGSITLAEGYGIDFDGLTRRRAGGFFGLDRDPVAGAAVILTGTHGPPASTLLNSIPFDAQLNGLDDLAETRIALYSVDFVTRRLHRIDPANGTLIASTPHDAAFNLTALAAPPPCDGDADGDGDRDFADITSILSSFGLTVGPFGIGDTDGNGSVNFADVTNVLSLFGVPCPL
jgi:hypothetical protein